MIPDDNTDNTEDPSAEPMDIDAELAKNSKKGDTDKGPSLVNDDNYSPSISSGEED